MQQKILLKQMDDEEHKIYHRRILYVIVLILLFLFGGATFYHIVENWRYIDALYFATATITTVGYGDITPRTDTGKIFTIFYLFMGVGTVLYGLSLIAAHFVEVREEFWLQKIGKIRIKHHTQTFWDRLKNLISFESEELVHEHQKESGRQKRK